MRLFGREVAVQFAAPGAGVGTRIEGLRTSFRVEHTADRTPSRATIEIYNLSPASRATASVVGTEVRLFIGYTPVPRLVFVGKPVRGGVNLLTRGADKVLKIDATDGGASFSSTTLSLTYAAGSPVMKLVDDILLETGWSRGFVAPITDTFGSRATLIGRPSELLDDLARRVSAGWFVRDGALYILPRGQSTPETAPVVSAEVGNLIGTPVATREGVRCRMLIDATMRPGRRLILRSPNIPSGQYIVRDAIFTGDSGFQASYYVDLVCRPVGAP